MPLRCLIVDDNAKFLEAAQFLLDQEGLAIVGVATSGAEAVMQAQRLQPDLALIDIELGEENGFELAKRLSEDGGPRVIIIISTHARGEFEDLIAAGPAVGFVAKTDLSRGAIRASWRTTTYSKTRVTDVDDLLDALDRVANGRSAVDPDLVSELFAAQRREDPLEQLITREREVLALMAEGRSNSGIARQLWLAGGTVEKHVKSILAKLDLGTTEDDHRRVQAVLTFLDAR